MIDCLFYNPFFILRQLFLDFLIINVTIFPLYKPFLAHCP